MEMSTEGGGHKPEKSDVAPRSKRSKSGKSKKSVSKEDEVPVAKVLKLFTAVSWLFHNKLALARIVN